MVGLRASSYQHRLYTYGCGLFKDVTVKNKFGIKEGKYIGGRELPLTQC